MIFSLPNLKAQDSINATQAAQLDTGKVYLSLIELRNISGYLKEVAYRRSKDTITTAQLMQYQSIVADYQKSDTLYKAEVNNLKKELKLVTPEWWDHFSWGAVAGVIVSTVGILSILAVAK